MLLFISLPLVNISCGSIHSIFNADDAERAENLKSEIRDLHRELASQTKALENLRMELSRQSYSVLCAGDIMIANEAAHFIEKEGPEYPFKRIKDDLDRYDVFFANLETPVTDNGILTVDKPYILKMDPVWRNLLKEIHIDALSLSNNHIMDYGPVGMMDTIRYCREMKIVYSGAGATALEARIPSILHPGITDILFLSYCERPPSDFYAGPERAGTAQLVLEDVIKDVKRYKKAGNVVLVSLHWGIEQRQVPLLSQRIIGHAILDAGADAIIGHHPHWPQGIEMYHGKPVIYSLGNFLSGFTNHIEKDNILAVLQYDRSRLIALEILPLAGKNHMIKYQPYLQTGKEAQCTLEEVKKLCWGLGTRMDIVGERGIIYP